MSPRAKATILAALTLLAVGMLRQLPRLFLVTLALVYSFLGPGDCGVTYKLGTDPISPDYHLFRVSQVGDVLYTGAYSGYGPAQVYRSTDGGESWSPYAYSRDMVESVSAVVEMGGQLYALTERPYDRPYIYEIPAGGGRMTAVASFGDGAQYALSYNDLAGGNVFGVSNSHINMGGYLGNLQGQRLTTDMWVDGEPASAWTAMDIPSGYLAGYSINTDYKWSGGVGRFNTATQAWSYTQLVGGVVQITDMDGVTYAATNQGGLYCSTDNFVHYSKVFQAETGGYDLTYERMGGRDVAISAAGSIYVDGTRVLHLDASWIDLTPTGDGTLAGFATMKDDRSYALKINLGW